MQGTSVQGTIVQPEMGDKGMRALGSGRPHKEGEQCISIRINSIFWHMGQIKK
jgi:hypothetical protein